MLVRSDGTSASNSIMMRGISLSEEHKLDKLDKKHIYFYGDVDPTKQEDIDIIKNYNFVHKDHRSILYSNFDYEAGNFALVPQYNGNIIDYIVKEAPCSDPVAWFNYNHCLLGKPKKVAVYSDCYDIFRR